MNTDTIQLGKLNERGNTLVRVALQVGWRGVNTKSGGVALTSPGGISAVVNPGNMNENRMESMYSKIIRYGDQVMVATLQAKVQMAATVDDKSRNRLSTGDMVRRGYAPSLSSPLMNDDDEIPARYVPEVPSATIVSEHPWLATRRNGEDSSKVYESPTTMERKWSDGSIDYACRHEGCEMTDPLPEKVWRHYQRSRSHPPVNNVGVETMNAEARVPQRASVEARRERLAREIATALDVVRAEHGDSWESNLAEGEKAALIAEQMIRERDIRNDRNDDPPRPKTAEETLETIRRLCDDGSYLRNIEQVRDLESTLAQAVQTIEDQSQQMSALTEKLSAVQGNWDALRSLVQSTGQSS